MSKKKLFVLDTNVLMHDSTCIYRFEEHDLFIPMVVLEELDGLKKGNSDVARSARAISRQLDDLVANKDHAQIEKGINLPSALTRSTALSNAGKKNAAASGKLFFQTAPTDTHLPGLLPGNKPDNAILLAALYLQNKSTARKVTLVTKDINLRIKAAIAGVHTEDYRNDRVLEDSDLLYTGYTELPADFWASHSEKMESWQDHRARACYRVRGPLIQNWCVNQFLHLPDADSEGGVDMVVVAIEEDAAVIRIIRDYQHGKTPVWGIHAKNREQNFALNLLLDPEIDFVSILGTAGTGKTLLTLAAGLAQVLDAQSYKEIIMPRVTVPLGDDIGFLPGTEEEKMTPWMGALMDNLEVLTQNGSSGDWERQATNDLIMKRVKIRSLNFMRGRTFLNRFVIVDEAQNLSAKQMKTLITRCGPGSKMICLGNLAQIDTPYLSETTSGLTYVVDRFRGWPYGGHVTLSRGERSRLAAHASEVL